MLTAPTGLAALNINGLTIHSALAIDVQRGSEGSLRELNGQRLQKLRVLYKNLRVLIIDEISMVSNVQLAKIHRRLVEIKGTAPDGALSLPSCKTQLMLSVPFGGVILVVLGDFHQLPPVRAQPIFTTIKSWLMNKLFGTSFVSLNLWEKQFLFK